MWLFHSVFLSTFSFGQQVFCFPFLYIHSSLFHISFFFFSRKNLWLPNFSILTCLPGECKWRECIYLCKSIHLRVSRFTWPLGIVAYCISAAVVGFCSWKFVEIWNFHQRRSVILTCYLWVAELSLNNNDIYFDTRLIINNHSSN